MAACTYGNVFSWYGQCVFFLCTSKNMKIYHLLAQPSRHFGPVISLWLWRCANFEIARATLSALCAHRDLLKRSCQEVSLRDPANPAQRALIESFCRDLIKTSCQETSCRDLVQRSCQETSYRDFVQRHRIEICCRDLAKRVSEIFETDLAKRHLVGRALAQRACQEAAYRDLVHRLA